MPTALARLLNGVLDELRSPVAPFPVDHLRTRLVAMFLYISNGLLITYDVFFGHANPWSIGLTALCFALAGLMTASQFVTERFKIPYVSWIRPIFFAHLAVVGPLRYLADPTAMSECLMLAGVFLYFIHGVDVRLAVGDVLAGSVIAYVLSKLIGIDADVTSFVFLVLTSSVAGLLVLAKELHLRRERMRTIRTLIGVMAHELRTPLATISVSADLIEPMLKEVNESERYDLLFQRLRGSVRYMHAIIDQQIANSGVANNQGETQLFNLSELVQLIHDEFPYRREDERSAIVLDLDPKVKIRCSQTVMRQIITNLHKNAITAVAKTNRTFAAGDVTLSVAQRGKDVVVKVSDRGVGIDPRDRTRIFDPFFSATPKATHGLGLTQVREAVHFMGGELSLESELGKGTTFTARFPAEIV